MQAPPRQLRHPPRVAPPAPAAPAPPDVPADAAGAREAAVPPPPPPAPLAASVAFTSCSVTTFGGIEVMITALSLSPVRKSDTRAGLPARMILTPRLSMSPCVNDLNPSSVRTMMVGPATCATVPFFTSVTVTGVDLVVVVMVAVPAMPGLSCCTDSCLPSTVKRKSLATVISLVPSGSLTTSWLPSTEMTSNFLVSVLVVV